METNGVTVQALSRVAEVSARAAKYLPEPATSGYGLFRDVLDIAKRVGDMTIGGVPGVASGDFAELLQLQITAQREMQTTTMVSNVERSKHESKMSAIRNIRVS